MNNQLTLSNQTNLQINEITTMGKLFAESGMFQDIKSVAQAVVKIQAGQEIGIPPFASMTGIHIIAGKPCVGAGLIASRVKASGKYDYKVLEQSDKLCSIEFFQNGESIGVSTFTYEDGKKAGTKNLDKFPRNMLFARSMSNGVKWFCPDVFNTSVYVPEEMNIENSFSSNNEIVLSSVVNSDLDMIQEIKEAKSKLELRELTAKYKGQYNSNPEFKKAFDYRVYELNFDLLEALKNELDGAKNEVQVTEIMNKSEYKILETTDLKESYKELGEEAVRNCLDKKRQVAIKQLTEAKTLNSLKAIRSRNNVSWYIDNDEEIKTLYQEMKDSFEQESTLPKNDKDLMEEASKEATPTKVLVNK